MQIRHLIILVISIFLFTTGCDAEITGTVVDAESGQPIEGAVVLVEWTKTKGLPGMTHTESYKVIEAVTDKEGKVSISGTFSPTVNPPHVTIYKKGYVAWNNEYIFPDYKKRTDFTWENGYVFRLGKFKSDYSYIEHVSFMRGAISSHMAGEKKKVFKEAMEWEIKESIRERQEKR